MKSRSFVAGSIVIASLSMLSTFAAGCASPPAESVAGGQAAATERRGRQVSASSDAAHAMLENLWHIDSAEGKDDVTIRVYSTGTGDAFNGNKLWLALDGGPQTGAAWDLGLDVRLVQKVEATGPGQLRIVGIEEFVAAGTGEVDTRGFEAKIAYRIVDGDVQRAIKVTTSSGTRDVNAATTDAAKFFGHVYDMTLLDTPDLHARLFEAGGGDPSMNGDRLYLTLMKTTFDLELDVSNVKRFVAAGPGELRIEVSEDTVDSEGTIVSGKPATYAVKYTLGDDGPKPTVTVSKL